MISLPFLSTSPHITSSVLHMWCHEAVILLNICTHHTKRCSWLCVDPSPDPILWGYMCACDVIPLYGSILWCHGVMLQYSQAMISIVYGGCYFLQVLWTEGDRNHGGKFSSSWRVAGSSCPSNHTEVKPILVLCPSRCSWQQSDNDYHDSWHLGYHLTFIVVRKENIDVIHLPPSHWFHQIRLSSRNFKHKRCDGTWL